MGELGPGDVENLRQEEWAAQEVNRLKARLRESQAATGRYADACESEHRLRLVAEADRDTLRHELAAAEDNDTLKARVKELELKLNQMLQDAEAMGPIDGAVEANDD